MNGWMDRWKEGRREEGREGGREGGRDGWVGGHWKEGVAKGGRDGPMDRCNYFIGKLGPLRATWFKRPRLCELWC